jgi:hypothetical protein
LSARSHTRTRQKQQRRYRANAMKPRNNHKPPKPRRRQTPDTPKDNWQHAVTPRTEALAAGTIDATPT